MSAGIRSAADILSRVVEEVDAADRRIRPSVRETPLALSPNLSAALNATVLLKLENTQVTGSFKVRGAVNRLLTMPLSQRELGVITASTGNHGAAVAYAAHKLSMRCTVLVPAGASLAKVGAIRAWGATIEEHGTDGLHAEQEARRRADAQGVFYLSPYNDPGVVVGQGTVGAELARQTERLDAVFIAVGGGGLIAGTAAYLKARNPDTVVIGCSAEASNVMYQSVKAGSILNLPSAPTLSDGTAGGVEADAMTFPLCRNLVDRWENVSEAEIAEAMRAAIDQDHQLIEGAAGVALAAARKLAPEFPRGTIGVVLCGGNVGTSTLRRVLS